MDAKECAKKRKLESASNNVADENPQKASLYKHKRTTLERIEKYISDIYFSDVNLMSQLYTFKEPVSVYHWPLPSNEGEWENWKFDKIIAQKFKLIKIGDAFGPTWATHWFKVTFTIPESWKGKQVVFKWKSQSEAMIWSKEGEPLQGLSTGISHQMRSEYIISKKWDGSEAACQFYIEMACNNMFGAGHNGMIEPPDPNKKFSLETAEICVINPQVKSLILDLGILHGMAKALKETPEGYQALYTANAMINTIILENLDKACKISADFFSKTGSTNRHCLALMGHCHIDSAWLWPYSETKRKCARSWASVLELMDNYPEMKFTCSQAQQFMWVKQHYPSLYARIKTKVQSGAFIPVGGTWVEMDGLIPSGESFIRQFLYGQKYFEEEFQMKCKEFWLPDTFGYSAQLPQILKHVGIERFLTQKLSWSLFNKFPHHNFIWEGLDRSCIIAHFPPGDSYEMNITVEEAIKTVDNLQDKGRVSTSAFLYGYGDGGGGPTKDMLERARRLQDIDGLPKMVHMTPDDFFTKIEAEKHNLCKWVGELFLELHNATYTSQAKTKQLNRQAEFVLGKAEMLLAMIFIYDYSHNSAIKNMKLHIDKAWKKVLLNQFHDVLPGSSIEIVYRDSDKLYNEAIKTGESVISTCLHTLLNSSDEANGPNDKCNILNTLPWPVQGIAEITDGNNDASIVAYEAPPMGVHSCGHVCTVPAVTFETSSNGNVILKNQHLMVEITNFGQIVQLSECKNPVKNVFNKEDNLRFGNRFTLYDDIPLFWDAWDTMDYHLETAVVLNSTMSDSISPLSVVENGPLRVKLKWKLVKDNIFSLTQFIELSATCKYVLFLTEVDWRANRKSLKVAFDTDIFAHSAAFDTQFGHLYRTTHNNTQWDSAQFEVCGHKWASLSEHGLGVAVLNDSKYGWHVKDGSIVLSLLRSPKSPDKNCDMGLHKFKYAVMPHNGKIQESGVIQASYELNIPPQVLDSSFKHFFKTKKWMNIVGDGVMIETVKLPYGDITDEKAVILRAFEIYGGTQHVWLQVPGIVKKIQDCNGLEEVSESSSLLLCDGKDIVEGEHGCLYARVIFKPFMIRTFKIYA